MPRYREVRSVPGGAGGYHTEDRVSEIGDKKDAPKGADPVPDDAAAHDWEPCPAPPQ